MGPGGEPKEAPGEGGRVKREKSEAGRRVRQAGKRRGPLKTFGP
jgi:hypothetical protein